MDQMLQVVDISNPANPVAVGELLTGSLVSRLQVAGSYAYTISPFRIIDISNPTNPELIKTFLLPEGYPPTAVTVKGNFAYVGDFYGFIFIIDISNPTDPIVIGQMLASGERVQNIVIQDTLLYATTSDGAAIDVFNISNLSAPFYITQIAAGLAGSPLAINEKYLFYGTGKLLRIYDISNPLNPIYIKEVNLEYFIYVISVINNTAFVTLGDGGLTSIDLTDSNNIHILTNIKNPYGFENDLGIGGPLGESLGSQYAYLSTGTGLWIVDISNANQLNSNSFFPTGLPPVNIAVDSLGYAYISELYAGMKIVDFTNATSPKLVSEYSPKESVRDVAIGQNEAYLLCDSDLIVLDISNHKAPRFLSKIAFRGHIE